MNKVGRVWQGVCAQGACYEIARRIREIGVGDGDKRMFMSDALVILISILPSSLFDSKSTSHYVVSQLTCWAIDYELTITTYLCRLEDYDEVLQFC